jgi:hypothetical protein
MNEWMNEWMNNINCIYMKMKLPNNKYYNLKTCYNYVGNFRICYQKTERYQPLYINTGIHYKKQWGVRRNTTIHTISGEQKEDTLNDGFRLFTEELRRGLRLWLRSENNDRGLWRCPATISYKKKSLLWKQNKKNSFVIG